MKPNEAIEILDWLKESEELIAQLELNGFQYWIKHDYRTQNQALDYAIELAKRDEGMKPISDSYNGYMCPSCNSYNIQMYDKWGDNFNLNYCNDCGQRLDWSDVE